MSPLPRVVERSLLAGTIVASLLTGGCDMMRKLHSKPAVERKTRAQPIATPEGTLEQTNRVVAPGIVEPWDGEVYLSPLESGWISRILVSEGQHVEAGQLLATLDDDTQKAAVGLAKAGLAEAETEVVKATHGTTAEELKQARADADATRARAELATSEAGRTMQLGSQAVASAADVERARAEAAAQDAIARKAVARLAELERGPRSEDRTAVRDRRSAARARLELAIANLERRHVVAPAAGIVLLSRYHVGEFFTVGTSPLFIVGDLSRLRVRVEVDEIDAMRFGPGAACAIYGDENERITTGTVFRVAPRMGRRGLPIETPTARADVRVREVFVEVSPGGALLPGRRVWAHIDPGTVGG